MENQSSFLIDVNATQDVSIDFPVLTDPDGKLSQKLGIVPNDFHVVHSPCKYSTVLVIDMDLTIQFRIQYPISVGRNIYEMIRSLDAIQLALYNQVVTPSNWKVNDDVFVEPKVTSEAAKTLFPQGFHEIKPYFRITPSPAVMDNE